MKDFITDDILCHFSVYYAWYNSTWHYFTVWFLIPRSFFAAGPGYDILTLSLYSMQIDMDICFSKFEGTTDLLSIWYKLKLLISHPIDQRPNFFDSHTDFILIPKHHSWLPEISNASRRTGKKYGAGLQCRALRQKGDLFPDRKDHIFSVSVLDHGAVMYGFDGKRLRVVNHTTGDKNRPYK